MQRSLRRFVALACAVAAPALAAPREIEMARRLSLEGRYDEARQKLDLAERKAKTSCERADVLVQKALASVEEMSFRGPASNAPLTQAQAAVREARACNDRWRLASAMVVEGRAHYALAFAGLEPGLENARARYAEALELRAGAPPGDRAQSLFFLGLVHEQEERGAEAEKLYREALALASQAKETLLLSYLHRHLGSFERPAKGLAGDLERQRESLRLRQEIHFLPGVVFARLAVGDVLMEMGSAAEAVQSWELALQEAGASGVRRGVVVAAQKLAEAAAKRGDPGRARELYALAVSVAREMGDKQAEDATKKAMAELPG
jgi:tetratricopeptide (TPR) repeat protein